MGLRLAAALAGLLAAQLLTLPGLACGLSGGELGVVTSVESADTLKLQSGGTVVLIGALPPELALDAQTPWPPVETSRAELERLVLGKTIETVTSGRRFDRYGRMLAQVFVNDALVETEPGSGRQWVQGELIAGGLARAYALPGSVACLDEMLSLEAAARSDRRGHWASGVFADRDASDLRALRGLRDTFATLEGVVARIDKVRGQPALAFTSGASESGSGLRAIMTSNDHPHGSGSQRNLDGLVGQRVRVRGWIERPSRPSVTLFDPRLIELLEVLPLAGSAPPHAIPAPDTALLPIPAVSPQ